MTRLPPHTLFSLRSIFSVALISLAQAATAEVLTHLLSSLLPLSSSQREHSHFLLLRDVGKHPFSGSLVGHPQGNGVCAMAPSGMTLLPFPNFLYLAILPLFIYQNTQILRELYSRAVLVYFHNCLLGMKKIILRTDRLITRIDKTNTLTIRLHSLPPWASLCKIKQAILNCNH